MIGTSGPSTSITALSTPSADSAAITCSAVEHSGPSSIAQDRRKFGCRHRAHVGANFATRIAIGAGALKHDAGAGIRRMHRQRDRRAGMNADAGDGHVVAQRRLLRRNRFGRVLACTSCPLSFESLPTAERCDQTVRSNLTLPTVRMTRTPQFPNFALRPPKAATHIFARSPRRRLREGTSEPKAPSR